MAELSISRQCARWARSLRFEDLPPSVIDKTQALLLHARAQAEIGCVPFGLLLNKADLESDWDLDPASLVGPRSAGWPRSGPTPARGS